MATLNFYLTAKNGGCDFADAGNFTSALAEALRVVYRSTTNSSTGPLPRYELQDVRSGSLKGLIAGQSGNHDNCESNRYSWGNT